MSSPKTQACLNLQVLTGLGGDKSLDKFKGEYERILGALKKVGI
jgi:hypothetical protein